MTVRTARTPPSAPPAWQEAFVEQVCLLFEAALPRSTSRVLGRLVVCEPEHQSAAQLQTTLRLSAGSVSSATATLVAAGIVRRVSFSGDRRTYYRLHSDGWQRLIRSRLQTFGEVRHVADEALLASGESRHDRLLGMRDLFSRLEFQLARLLEDRPTGA